MCEVHALIALAVCAAVLGFALGIPCGVALATLRGGTASASVIRRYNGYIPDTPGHYPFAPSLSCARRPIVPP